jgi:hypothetical protein
MTLLWIRDKGTPADPKIAEEKLKNKLEAFLRKAESAPAELPATKEPGTEPPGELIPDAELPEAVIPDTKIPKEDAND